MSVELVLTGSALDDDGWEELLEAWSEGQDLFEGPRFANGEALLLGEGSVRGALLRRSGDALQVRLGALASRADWRRAYSVVREALSRGGGTFTREDGTALPAAALTDEAADAAALRDFVVAAQVVSEQSGAGQGPTLPLGRFALPVLPGDLPRPCRPEDVPVVEERLAARVARYARAFDAMTVVLSVDGKRVRLATWARSPTLLAANVDCVALQGLEEPVPLAPLLERLGERAERLGERLYLPALDEAAGAELVAALRAASLSVERFVAERRATLEDDAGPSPGGAGGLLDDVQRAARGLAEALVSGRDVKDAQRELLRDGVRKDTVDAVFAGAAVILQAVQDEGGPGARANQRIAAAGVPETLREAVLREIARAARRRRRRGRACCCALLVCIIVALAVALAP